MFGQLNANQFCTCRTEPFNMNKIRLSHVLKAELKTRDLTINKMAKDCSIPVSVLHGWINGTVPSAKNIHHIKTLSEYLNVSVEKLLFDNSSTPSRLILFSSTFMDGKTQYKLTIEKLED